MVTFPGKSLSPRSRERRSLELPITAALETEFVEPIGRDIMEEIPELDGLNDLRVLSPP